jgi:hypothetical protein
VVALSAIFLAIVFVLSGCGADSSSPKTDTKKKIVVKALPGPQGPGKVANAPKGELNLLLSDSLSALTPEELRAKREAAERAMSDPNFEALPGVTVRELRAKEAEALRKINDPNFEALPGVTVAELRAKEAEALRKVNDPNFEALPGVTVGELKAKKAAAAPK